MSESNVTSLTDRREIMTWRKAKRAELIAARVAFPRAEHAAASTVIEKQLMEKALSVCLSKLGFYWPIKREFNPLKFVETALDEGAILGLPVCVEKFAPLVFRRWEPGVNMESDKFGFPFPADTPAIHPNVLLVPLVGFDAAGYRLGYGGGYYDRTNAALEPRPLLIGVGFELGRLPSIHPLPHDIPMDHIITEAGLFSR